jgi:hypothetical protein
MKKTDQKSVKTTDQNNFKNKSKLQRATFALFIITALAFTAAYSLDISAGAVMRTIFGSAVEAAPETRAVTRKTRKALQKSESKTTPLSDDKKPSNLALSALTNGSLTTARAGHTATRLDDGNVLIAGGDAGTFEIFNPALGSSAGFGNLTTARSGHTATKLADGRVLLTGGDANGAALSSTEIFDPSTGAFSAGAPMNTARSGHTATVLADGRILIAGGDAGGSAETYAAATGSFTSLETALTAARAGHSAAVMNDGRIIIVGGENAAGEELNTVEIFNPADSTFTATGNVMAHHRSNPFLRALPDGKVQIIGGNDDTSMEVYDPAIDTIGAHAHLIPTGDEHDALMQIDILNTPTRAALFHTGQADAMIDRENHSITELGNQALVAGGTNTAGQTLSSLSILDSSSATVTTDKLDYAPGETAVISGTGWQAGETVNIILHEDPHTHTERRLTATADASGNFTANYLVDLHDLNVTFIIGAKGQTSGKTAQTTFTDSQPTAVSLTPASVSVTPGNIAGYAANVTMGGNSTNCPMTFSLAYNSITPTNVTTTFTGGNSVTTNASFSKGFTLTTTNSGAPATRTQPGTYPFTLTVARGTGCQGSGNETATGTLIVTSSTNLSVSSATGTFGGTTNLTATLTRNSDSTAINGKTISFTLNGNPVGNAVTNASGVASLSGVSLTGINAGSYPTGVGASFAGDTVYLTSSGSNSLTVSKANQTITFGALANKTFGDPDFTVSATASSTLTVAFAASGNCTVSGTTVHITGAGSCTITASQTGNGNYNAATPVPQSFNIAKATPTITWANPADITYGTALGATQLNATASVPGSFVYTPASGAVLNAGNGQNLHADFTPTDTANYNNASKDASINVSKANLTVTANNKTITYGDPEPTFDFAYGAFAGSDTAGAIDTSPTCTVSGAHADAGSYPIVCSGGTDNNYNFSFVNGTLTVQKATLTVTADDKTITYGDSDPAFTFAYSGFKFTETASVIDSAPTCTVAGPHSNAGSYPIVCAGGTDNNYELSFVSGTLTVEPKAASVAPNAASKIYGETDPAFSGTLAGFLSGDNVTAVYSRTAGETVAGSPYTISAVLSATGLLSNYDVTYNTALFVINKATPSVNVTGGTFIYDGAAHPATAAASGVFGAVAGSFAFTYTPPGDSTEPVNAGLYGVTVSFTSSDPNYTDAAGSGSITIDKAASSTSVSCPASVTYTGSAQTPCTASVTGAGDLNESLTVSYTNNTNAGIAGASATYAGDANHETSSDSENFTIDKAASTTTVSCPASVTYNGAAQTPCTASVTGAGDLNEALTLNYSDNMNAGTASANASFGGDDNHTGSSNSATFAIAKAAVTATAGSGSTIYDGSPKAPSACAVTGAYTGDLTCANDPATVGPNAGTTTIAAIVSGTGLTNFEITPVNGSFTIAKADSTTVVTCPASVIYTGAAQTPCTVAVTGAGGLNLTPAPNYTNNIVVGTATASYNYAGDDNHEASGDSENFAIDKADSVTTITCPASVTYNGSAQEPCTATVTGAGDLNESLTINYTNNTDAGTANASASYAGDANHNGSSDSETFAIAQAASTTVVVCPANVTYTGSPIEPCTASVTGAGGLNEAVAVVYANNTNAGTANATATFAGDANHTGSNDAKTFAIDQATSTTVVTCPASVVYNGSAQTPCTANVTGAGGLNESLAVSYSGNTNVGTATAEASFAGDLNHTSSSDSETFAITKAPVTATAGSGTTTFDGFAHSPAACVVSGAYTGDLSCANSPATVGPNAGTTTISPVVSGTGLGNFEITPVNGSYTIDKASSTTVVTCPANVVYNGAAQTPCSATVTGAGGLSLTPTPNYTNNTNAGTATASYNYAGDANHNGSSDSKNFAIDKANPTVTATGGSFVFSGAPIPGSCSVTGVGGVNLGPLAPTYIGSGSTVYPSNPLAPAAVGSYTVNCDYAGSANYNAKSNTAALTIGAWTLTGFYQPVDMSTPGGVVLNTIKGGSTVPLKFNIRSGSTELKTTAAVLYFQFAEFACGTVSGFEAPIEVTTTGGTSLRYDTTAGQFIQNWQTPKAPNKCYQVRMTALDGSHLDAFFKTK